jgi:hypothetical protein
MRRYYGIGTNHQPPVLLVKTNTGALYKRHGKHGFAIVSANRSTADSATNERKTRELVSDLKKSGYRYLPVYGGSVGTDGVEDDYDPSFIVFPYRTTDPYDIKANYFSDFGLFKKFVLELCGKYGQTPVLVMDPGGTPNYYDKDGTKVDKSSSPELFPTDPHFNEGRGRERAFFLNPNPATMGDRIRRSLSGEILLRDLDGSPLA